MIITYRLATIADIDSVLALQHRYHIDTITSEDKLDGFITTGFDRIQLATLINTEQGLFIAEKGQRVVAYAMSTSWSFWLQWPMFAFLARDLSKYSFSGNQLTIDNTYQYGPICIDRAVRGQGVLEGLFAYSLTVMSKRYPILLTFINKDNHRSFAAHVRKLGLVVIDDFVFNDKQYHLLACKTL